MAPCQSNISLANGVSWNPRLFLCDPGRSDGIERSRVLVQSSVEIQGQKRLNREELEGKKLNKQTIKKKNVSLSPLPFTASLFETFNVICVQNFPDHSMCTKKIIETTLKFVTLVYKQKNELWIRIITQISWNAFIGNRWFS